MNAASPRLPLRSSATMLALGTVGAYITVLLGVIVPEWIQRGIADSTANFIVSSEKAGMALSALGFTAVIQRWDRRKLGVLFLLGLVVTNLASAHIASAGGLFPLRFLCGVCEGGVIALMTAAAMDAGTADRTFGIYLTTTLLLSVLLMPSVAMSGIFNIFGAMTGETGLPRFFYTMAIVSLLVVPFMRFFPASRGEVSAAAEGTTQAASEPEAGHTMWKYLWPALIATALFEACIMAIWNNMIFTATSAGYEQEAVLSILTSTLLIGIPGGLAAAVLADRWGRALPLTAGVGAMLLSLVLLIAVPGGVPFAVIGCLFALGWFFTLPYFVGAVAALDTTGKAATLSIAFQTGGLMAGPLLAGAILGATSNNYAVLPYVGAGLLVACLVLVLPTVSQRAQQAALDSAA